MLMTLASHAGLAMGTGISTTGRGFSAPPHCLLETQKTWGRTHLSGASAGASQQGVHCAHLVGPETQDSFRWGADAHGAAAGQLEPRPEDRAGCCGGGGRMEHRAGRLPVPPTPTRCHVGAASHHSGLWWSGTLLLWSFWKTHGNLEEMQDVSCIVSLSLDGP